MYKEIQHFHGGIIDSYLTAKEHHSKVIHNLWIDENTKPYTRWGIKCWQYRLEVTAGSKKISGCRVGAEPFQTPFFTRGDKVFYINESDWREEIAGPTANPAMPNKGDNDIEDMVTWRKQVLYASPPASTRPGRIYCSSYTSTRAFQCYTLGLPAPATQPTCTPDKAGAGYNYIYSFVYVNTFTDYEGFQFREISAPTLGLDAGGASSTVDCSAAIAAGGADGVTVTGIPVLTNGVSANYDTSNVEVWVYRTTNNGDIFYYVGKVTNGTVSFDDDVPDSTIDDNAVLYTTGDILENDQPPEGARYLTQVNDFFWYATEELVTHSKQGAPGHCPDEYWWYTDRRIKGLSNIISFPILFTDGPIYRLEGTYDEFGDKGFEFREIHATAGCMSNASIVRIPGGLVWAGNDGFYFSDGYKVQLISKGIPTRYEIWKNSKMYGVYDSRKRLVHWTISHDGSEDSYLNDRIVSLHLDFGFNDGYGSFATWGSDRNIYPVSLGFCDSEDIEAPYRGRLLIGEVRGYFLYQDNKAYTDVCIDESALISNFKEKTISYRKESIGYQFDTDTLRRYCSELTAAFKVETELAAQFLTRRDDGGIWDTFSEIRKDGPITFGITEWYDVDDTDLDDSTIYDEANSYPIAEGKRYFPSGTLRSLRRQIGLRNAYTYIAKSDDYATVTIDASARTVTLASGSWPNNCEDYYLYFNDDSYDTAFLIKDRVSDTVVEVYDPGTMVIATGVITPQLTSGSGISWEMKGYRKNERMYLLSYAIHFDDGEQTLMPNRGDSTYRNS